MTRRVVITGMAVLAPGGNGVRAFWDLISSGRTATRPITLFDASGFRSRIAGEVDFDGGPAELRHLDRAVRFAVLCAQDALLDSGITVDEFPAHRIGVGIGTAVGCTTGLDREYAVVSDSGRSWLVDHTKAVPQLFDYLVPTSFAAEVAWAVGAEGPASVISTGCTSGLDAIGYGCELIREGSVDVVIAGASDAPISPITVACFDALKATSTNNEYPGEASRPFDRNRDGFVLAEGAAVFVLEELAHARRRGARIQAEVTGYATRCNAHHMTGLHHEGREMAEAIRAAMAEARIWAGDIDYINAHGSGTRQNDRHETAAFKRALGDHAYRTPVSSIKSMVGHSLGAIGSIELAASALVLEHNLVPPTANLHEADPECDLDYVPLVAREQDTDAVLCVGSGFGGFQSAVILERAA
ncbi:beta-ketoacyl-[acyl-carrier-protein] synthase family protein [Amycolatopsis decaplanina]|uniref:Beta-ketoacyl synthase n=2 Tax=Amycolatopsis decaplanina TaxID=208441 RepID=M2YS01_9PSEU|nr:beta-ketoacyl-[acyl-carrier-protein] synthase family protein [Amycolatopsis decaplanina]EME57642.1 beta-ketoacyl synthase [Amycolatopsis decaplanina DSM 44594]